MKITGNIITLNEENNIKDCIFSLQQVCAEVIVVDSHSLDNTVKIAEELGAKIIRQSYLGDGPQKNVVLSQAKYDWILSIDADERLDDEMVSSIVNIKTTPKQVDAYSFKRKSYIGNRWIKQCGWYPDVCIRLYNKNRAKFKDVAGHSSVVAKKTKLLDGNIIHYSYKNYHDLLHRTNRFSTRGSKMFLEKSKNVSRFSPFTHFLFSFIKKYILQKGLFQGMDGLTVSLAASINSYMKYAKYIEMQKENTQSDSLWEP